MRFERNGHVPQRVRLQKTQVLSRWKRFRSFKSYVLSSVVAANLLTIARKKLAAI
jgi:hypothetical protein